MTTVKYTLILKGIEVHAHGLAAGLEKLKDAHESVSARARTTSKFVVEARSAFAGER
ncbi:hypothetical protein [Streptomyces microflavus]|uniref:hypothetical protein n=1 Tax=Streptomyces microflavus TaxID=1919 RepID=UPI0033E4FD27